MSESQVLDEQIKILSKRATNALSDKEFFAVEQGVNLNVNTLIQVKTGEDDILPESVSLIQKKLNLTQTTQGQPVCNLDNVLKILESCDGFKDQIWYDEFHQKTFTTWRTEIKREWTDSETITLQVFLQRSIGLSRLSKETVFDAVLIFAKQHTKNEPKDWMETLVWDNTPRIEKLFVDYFGAEDNDFTRSAGKNFGISLVARIYQPGCKVDTMPVLEGGQGTFKSTGVEALVGKDFYCDAHESVTSKDFFQIFRGKLLIEIAELDAFSRAEVTRVKQIITCKNDRYRASYARLAEDHPRQCVFVGTTNDDNYLKDSTGARRFWPIKIGFINIPLIKADRDQLFAEAVHLFKNGVAWWEMPESTQDEQEERRQVDPWEAKIHNFIEIRSEVTTSEILDSCLFIPIKEQTRFQQMRVGEILKLLQWEKKKKRFGLKFRNVYMPKVKTLNEKVNYL